MNIDQEAMNPNKIDSFRYPNEYLYLGTLLWYYNPFFIFKFKDSMFLTHFEQTVQVQEISEIELVSNLNKYKTVDLGSDLSSNLFVFWRSAYNIWESSKKMTECWCGAKSIGYTKSNIGHSLKCNYMKSIQR
jgi:hypothetical protein